MAQAQRRPQARRAARGKASRAGQTVKEFVIMGVVMAAIVIAVIIFKRVQTNIDTGKDFFATTDTFFSGVMINGIDLVGMTYDEGVAAVHQQIDNRLNSTIALHYNSTTYTITPAALEAKMLEVDNNIAGAWAFGHVGSADQRKEQIAYVQAEGVVAFNSVLQYNEKLLDDFIAMVKVNVDKQFVDATIEVDKDENFTVTQHQDGVWLEVEPLRAQIVSVIEQGTSANIQLQPRVWYPKFRTEELQQVGVLLSARRTKSASSNENRTKNIIRAFRPFNKGIRIDPGQTLTFNDIVGPRTVAEGFFQAPEIVGGELTDGIGGGTCQASSTLFPALIEAGLTIEERWSHSLLVAYCKPSQDSTVTDGGKNLVFSNYTEFPIYIFGSANYSEAVVRIYGRKPEYKIKYVTRYVQEGIKPTGWTKVPDKKGKYAKKKGDRVKKTDGKDGCITEGWIQYYDWDTNEFIREERRFRDEYAPVNPEYYVYYSGD